MADQKRTRAVFFDRDGVVVRAIPRKGFKLPTSPFSKEELEIFPWVSTALEVLRGVGFLRVLVTNQSDVRKGLVSYGEWRVMQDKVEELGFDDIFICPHLTEDNCECKKPKPGMLLRAAEKWGIDLSRSYMIGDTAADILTARATGCTSILVKGFYNLDVTADYMVDNVIEAVFLIFRLVWRGEDEDFC